jgi:hypothetical protein
LYWKTRFFHATAGLWKRLAAIESGVLRDEMAEVSLQQPIYIAGVARSGTTILTEILSRHPDVTSHRYSDFPNVFTPYWRNWIAERVRRAPPEAGERAHKDRLLVTTESPEAVEEVMWMQFFEDLHDPSQCQVLDSTTSNPDFERFYREHVSKLLAVRGASRYLAKGNYNTTRLAYIARLFPDARFIIPWREPVAQVASLVKQDRLFTRMAEEDPRVPGQLARSGHFEFGPDKRAVNVGSRAQAEAIERDWAAGALAIGWARYWADVYAHLLDAMEDDRRLADAVLLVDYQQLCERPEATLLAVRDHCRLDPAGFDPLAAEYTPRLSLPDYYVPEFGDDELASIHEITETSLARLRSATANSNSASR